MDKLKALLSVIVIMWSLFGGIIVAFFALIDGGELYFILAIVWDFVFLFVALSWIWSWFRKKPRIIISCVLLVPLLLFFGVSEGIKSYDRNMDSVGDQSVDLMLYQPFTEDTKAVSLSEEATLKLDKDLPKMDGATALYPLYAAFARAVYPEDSYSVVLIENEDNSVVCTTTSTAYERLISGEADIIFVAGPSEEQRKMAEDHGIELNMTPIGKEAFVFFVNSKNGVDDLKTDDIKKIYSGEATNWQELGGKNKPIRAFQRNNNSGSQTMLIKIMGSTPLMTPEEDKVETAMGTMINGVTAYKNYGNAIGYSFLFFATEMVQNNKIKLLSINGIAPTRENVANGTYPYSADFYAITAGTPDENTQKLIDWILSEQGQEIVTKTGYTPQAVDKVDSRDQKSETRD